MAQILTQEQIITLRTLATTELASRFYFSGGTALSYYYLHHRFSEDLDFFSVSEVDLQSIIVTLRSVQEKLHYASYDVQNSFNRNLFFLKFDNGSILKLEFTYYPFIQVEPPKFRGGLLVDSVLDIAVNKLFTIFQKARGRDYYDMYCILQKYNYTLERLRMLAKQKFDWDVDPLQLASKLYQVDQYTDDPILVKTLNRDQLISFFQREALNLDKEILDR